MPDEIDPSWPPPAPKRAAPPRPRPTAPYPSASPSVTETPRGEPSKAQRPLRSAAPREATVPAAPRHLSARPSTRDVVEGVICAVALLALVLGIAAVASRSGLPDELVLLLDLLPAISVAICAVAYALVTRRRHPRESLIMVAGIAATVVAVGLLVVVGFVIRGT
jgi:hypothetical protein